MKCPFRIKVCGVTRPEDARAAATAGADALGLNFYPRSPRHLAVEQALAVRQAVPPDVCCVGVFVNAAPAEVAAIDAAVLLDALQFHGDETPAYLAELRNRGGRLAKLPVLRAFRCRQNNYREMAATLDQIRNAGVALSAALIDAFVEGKYGGGGETLDWQAFRDSRPLLGDLPLVLAGGLTPDNVAAAIALAQPDAVDVASGVERQAGIKDAGQMRRFVEQARAAFDRLER